jgi:hypothetical protein
LSTTAGNPMVLAPVGRAVCCAASENSDHLTLGSATFLVMSRVRPEDSSWLDQEPKAYYMSG